MDNKPKNREWVKTAAIIFLTVLLILTFFSNTINNRLLPEVSTTAVTDGTITASVRASGKVEAAANNEVKATGTRTVAAVKVKAGQEVSTGDVLFVMGSAASEELEAAEDARDSAYYSYRRAQVSYPVGPSSVAVDRAYEAWVKAQYEQDEAYNRWVLADTNPDLVSAKDALNIAAAELADAQAYGDNYRKQMFDEYLALQETITEPTEEQMELLNHLLIEATTISDRESFAEYDYTQKESRYKAIVASINTTALKTAYETAASKADTAYAAYVAAIDSYNTQIASTGPSYATAQVTEEEAQNTYNKKQDRYDSLSGEGEDANVYAAVNGIIESINVSAGNTVTKGDVLCTIEVPDMGYVMSATVTADQAKRLKVGDTAQASNFYWGKTVNAEITSIKPDPKDPQGKRIVTFDVSGDVTNKQELTLNVGTRSASYDIIVPKSAVMSDNNGSFVLIIESKSSPLGNRYFARRVPVEVIAEDDSFRAVSGSLGNGDFVITNSSTKINSGDQVRLADAA